MPVTSLCYKGNISHRIRRKMATLEATFFLSLFRLFSISPFYRKCNLSPPLGNYKKGGRDHINERGHLAKITIKIPLK
jgi:hypothetical protein